MAEDLLPTDPETVGPYRLLRRLGTGGMGQVYLARSLGGRMVAVKVIRPDLAAEPGFRARFAREVTAARTVSGIFTAPVVDADPDGPQPWLATAYVPGPSLAAAVAERGPLPADMVLTLGAGLAEGLQAIHAAGLVHRDLKPSNVLLADDGPRVIDFGISRAADSSMLTQSGTIMGSPGFLSPEQAEGREVGPPSDVFSLGAVLAFAASGEGPFGTGTAASLVYRVVNAAPNLSNVPEQLRPVIERCLAKDPAVRPTAGELLASFGAGQQMPAWLPQSGFAGPPATPGTGSAASIGSAEYQARTQTHLTPGPQYQVPAPPGPDAGRTPPARLGGGTTPAWAPPGPVWPPAPPGPPQSGWPQGAGGGPAGTAAGRRGVRGQLALIAGAAAVLAAVAAGIPLALSSHPPASNGSPSANNQTVIPATTSPAPTQSPQQQPLSESSAVVGVWNGTYVCNQGLTGMRLTITDSGADALRATVEFFAVASNPGVLNGSYELTGNYSAAKGLVLIPDYWINQPPGYEMVGLSGPSPSGNSMHGTVQGVSCTTFSVAR